MKKSLALVLGIVFGVALAVPAFAASPIEFEGVVKVFHESLNNFTRAYQGPKDSDNFFWNRLQINVTFQPSDTVKVFWQFRGPDSQRWGTGNTTLFTRALYGEMTFDWGTVRAGHILDGLPGTVGGLASLGYAPAWGSGDFDYMMPFDYNTPVDAITYDNKWDLAGGHKFGFVFYYDKIATNFDDSGNIVIGPYPEGISVGSPLVNAPYNAKDQDYDIFGVEASYEWDTGGFTFGVEYDRNLTDKTVEKDYAVFINPAFVQSFGPFAIHFEGKIGWGKRTYDKNALDPTLLGVIENVYLGHPWDGSIENKGLGLYLDGTYTYAQGDVTFAGWYVSGSNFNEKRGSLNSLVDLGDFAPFLVAFNGQSLGTGAYSDVLGSGWMSGTGNSGLNIPGVDVIGYNTGLRNQWGIAILGNHTLVPDLISMNYGIGYFRLVKPTFVWIGDPANGYQSAPAVPAGTNPQYRYQSKDLGWEIDLGFTFQIYDNVAFETQFGYFFNGNAFETWDDGSKSWKDAKDTFAWGNAITFSF